MSQPWGLSGPQFLVIYGAGAAVALVAPFLLRQLIRAFSGGNADSQLDPREVGYLAGGPARAAQVVIADFLSSGALRVNSSGRVTVAHQAAFGQQSAFLTEGTTGTANPFWDLQLPAGIFVHQLQGKIARRPAIKAVKARLRAQGLLVSRARVITVSAVSLLLWAALFTAGGLRLAEGAHNHRPTGDLQSLVLLSGIACLCSLLVGWGRLVNLTTFRGARLLRRMRSAERQGEEARWRSRRGAGAFSHGLARSPGLARNGFGFAFGAGIESAALLGVALAGFAAVEDEATRSALLAGLPSSSGGSGCGGGGGGCGGGGCGGGGCGG